MSHGSRELGTEMLPVDNLDGINPETQGVIVDNFLPGVGAVIVYTSEYSGGESSVDVKYMAKWVLKSDLDTSEYMEQIEYLEELHEDLRFFQALELSGEACEPYSSLNDAVWENTNLQGMYSSHGRAGNQLNSCLDTPSVTEEWYAPVDVGMDPVEFLLEEISRVEGEMDFLSEMNLKEYQYGYIPYGGSSSVDTETLNILVIYSEPTMVKNSSGQTLTDRIWMRGYVHEDVLWNSQEDGVFVRDTPSGNADHTALVQEEMGQMFPSKPDAAYAVHYTYQGDLPSEFCGTIQSFIGTECTGVLSGGVQSVSTVSRSSTLGPRDLAGHLMDADPSTVPATRQGFESWDGVSPGLHSGYESQSEPHYFWGVPSWSISGGMAFARISADTVAEVDLVATGLQDAVFFGGCFPWYGFWMYHEVVGETGFNIPVIRYDGVVVNHSFNTKFPVGTQVTGNQFWHGRLRRGPFGGTEYIVSQDQCYFWMTGGNIGLYESEKTVTCISDAYVYSVNSQTGATSSRLLAVGTTSQDNSDIEAPPTAHSKICRIYQSGAALVEYSTPYGILQYDILYPPGGGATDVTEESSLTAMEDVSIAVEQERSFAVLSNPVKESLDVLVSGSSGDKWNLTVFDISGRCVLADTGVCREIGSVLNYGTGSFPSGIYIIRIEVEGEDEVQSISIVH